MDGDATWKAFKLLPVSNHDQLQIHDMTVKYYEGL